MSHHFNTKLAKEEPSLNLCDFYLCDGPSGKTVMAMTVNPDVGLSAPDTLHPEELHAFRFDLNGDAREEVTFKFRFGEPRHGGGSEHTQIQPFVVRKATGDDALRGDAGGDDLCIGERSGKRVSACGGRPRRARETHRAARRKLAGMYAAYMVSSQAESCRSDVSRSDLYGRVGAGSDHEPLSRPTCGARGPA